MISKFDILSIDEWNEHDLYSNFPIRKEHHIDVTFSVDYKILHQI